MKLNRWKFWSLSSYSERKHRLIIPVIFIHLATNHQRYFVVPMGQLGLEPVATLLFYFRLPSMSRRPTPSSLTTPCSWLSSSWPPSTSSEASAPPSTTSDQWDSPLASSLSSPPDPVESGAGTWTGSETFKIPKSHFFAQSLLIFVRETFLV